MFRPFAASAALAATLLMGCSVMALENSPGNEPNALAWALEGAIRSLDREDESLWTRDGKPRVDALERALGYDITAADRDAAWEALQAPLAAPLAAPPEPRPFAVEISSERYEELLAERNSLQGQLATERGFHQACEADASALRLRVAGAERDRDGWKRRMENASAELLRVREDASAAEARAAGYGPAVSPRCVRGVHAALAAGWRFSDAEKDALRRACLEPPGSL